MSDLINRQAAIEVASKECYELRGVFGQIEEGLNELPTVEAIPIEWINSYTTGLIFSDDYVDNADSIDDYIYCIKEMVRDWEKENENR